jgi:alanine-glyoxylate transaminase/serine-glyoxylate transaminase/serine-pyruvate transaminase
MLYANRVLLGPGPSDVHPLVLQAMTTPLLGHLDPQFLQIMNETQEMLCKAFLTRNHLTFPVSATGMAGMETCIANLLEPGERLLVCVAGYFSGRMVEVAGRHGIEVSTIERSWGEVFDPQQIREAVQKVRPKVLAVVQAETSTGAWQPIKELGPICREANALLLVDAVTALGGVPLEVDAWGVDAVYSCSQKCLGCPPGLSPVTFSPRAVEAMNKRKTKVQCWYLDASMVNRYWGEERFYHHTAPISMIFALHAGLRMLHEEGLQARWARHLRHHLALKAGLTAMGLRYAAVEGHQLPMLNAVRVPDGIDDAGVRKRLLSEFGIEIGSGLGEFKGKAWRIGLMGYNARANCVLLALGALEQCLLGQGHKGTAGAGVAAANRAYLAQH